MKLPSLPLWLEIALAILIALALSNVVTIILFRASGEQRFNRFTADFHAQRVAGSLSVIARAPADLQAELVKTLSGPGLTLSYDTKPLVADGIARDATVEAAIGSRLPDGVGEGLRAHVVTDEERAKLAAEPRKPPEPARVRPDGGPGKPGPGGPMGWGGGPPRDENYDFSVSLPTADGHWLNGRFGTRPGRMMPWFDWPLFYAGGAALIALLIASFWVGRRVAQPLNRLADAARSLRLGEMRGAVPETGPTPVREAARAFNAMSERVLTMLKSQRAMMAAVAHDLRTPIAALRFRAELVSEEETKSRLLETICEMQAMTEAVLDALRIDGAGEPARSVDVGMLADSLCADMAELGSDVTYTSDIALACNCRAAEVRRALRNLIENALRYGKRARVSAESAVGFASIHVDDDGPGIPDAEIERVFEPFARLDESRNSDTGGHGLGLAIARLIARGHGGDISLANRSGGGLRATLRLPLG